MTEHASEPRPGRYELGRPLPRQARWYIEAAAFALAFALVVRGTRGDLGWSGEAVGGVLLDTAVVGLTVLVVTGLLHLWRARRRRTR